MKKRIKIFIPLITISYIIAGCSADTTLKSSVDTSETVVKINDSSNDATIESTATENSSSDESDSDVVSSLESSTSTSFEEDTTIYDSSLPTVVFLGDDQFDLGRNENTSISYYVESLLGTDVNIINLGCSGVTATTALGTDNDTGMNFVNIAKFLNGEMDNTFFNNFPDAKEEAFIFDPSEVDFYVVEYGINDFLQSKALVNNIKESDTTCYINAMTVGLDILVKTSPNAKIILCSPIYSMFYADDGSVLGSGNIYSNPFGKYLDYCAGCTRLNSLHNSIGFDAFGSAMMNINDQTISDYMEEDGIHLSRAGRNTFAAVVAHMINKQLGLDNTEIEIAYNIDDYKLENEK